MPCNAGLNIYIFNRGHAETVGLDVESGEPIHFKTVTGSFGCYGHAVTLETLGFSFDVTVYFAEHERFTRNVLGRCG